jgi:hypothetical protein
VNEFEVPEPILNGPYEEPQEHRRIVEGEPPRRDHGRRPGAPEVAECARK